MGTGGANWGLRLQVQRGALKKGVPHCCRCYMCSPAQSRTLFASAFACARTTPFSSKCAEPQEASFVRIIFMQIVCVHAFVVSTTDEQATVSRCTGTHVSLSRLVRAALMSERKDKLGV